jgi:hypothetical protein
MTTPPSQLIQEACRRAQLAARLDSDLPDHERNQVDRELYEPWQLVMGGQTVELHGDEDGVRLRARYDGMAGDLIRVHFPIPGLLPSSTISIKHPGRPAAVVAPERQQLTARTAQIARQVSVALSAQAGFPAP